MARAGLTAKYRPQFFKEIVGQDFIKKILSRASQQDRPASAYLFSGTRGVGKTTAARIMAKAVNCVNGPDLEPCNQCSNCSQVTSGIFPDVMEIDAASHTGVDNVRKLREDAVYMPMSGRYKVIIIDEAHMLSNQAFNALLKTLEEPPKHCVFIMATTAPEKFPPTVISRCQHYVFQMVALEDLTGHLKSVLDREGIGYDSEAVTLIAKKGAGSVRDSMSILSQVIAIGGDRIEASSVRQVLGLAGQEVYADFFQAILNKDLISIHSGINNILGHGLDIGFFLQEFAACWRNLFLFSQSGKAAAKILDLPAAELEYWQDLSAKIPAPLIHAGWQMVIEERKSILQSHEPSLALELLFFNLAYLPELLPVGEFKAMPVSGQSSPSHSGGPFVSEAKQAPEDKPLEPDRKTQNLQLSEEEKLQDNNSRDCPGFMEFVRAKQGIDESLVRMLGKCDCGLEDNVFKLVCNQEFIFDTIQKNGRAKLLTRLVQEYFGPEARVEFVNNAFQKETDFKEKALNHPVVKKVLNDFDAKVVEIRKANS
ncbi:MAG: DNA polymerase III subunit gamma/tau [Desulfonatronovibrio sp.]